MFPHNLEAERATLGAAIVHQAAADTIVDAVTEDAFYRKGHRVLFEAIRDLRHNGTAVDFVTLKNRLGPRLDEAGGIAYMTALTDGVPRSTNVAYYVGILKDLQARRALVRFAQRTLDLVSSAEHSADEIIGDTDRRLIDLQNGHIESRLRSLRDGASSLYTDLQWRVEHQGELTGVPTGYNSINEMTLGWQAGDLIVEAARPSIGKTVFALNTAVAAAKAGVRVAIFSLEMRRRQLEYRLLSHLSGVPATRILGGHLGRADYGKVTEALALFDALPIEIDDRAGQSIWDIRAAARRLKAEGGLGLFIVDYIQLMPGTLNRRGATRNEEVTDISRRLKALADEVTAAGLVLSQLSRAAKDRQDKRPQLTDLRESGALEQDADIVAFLHRKDHRASGTTEFILSKQRNGPTGTVLLTIDRDTQTFTDGGEPEPEPAPKEAPKRRPKKYGDMS